MEDSKESLIYFKNENGSFFFSPFGHGHTCGILVPGPGIEPGHSNVRVQSPNHWTLSESPVNRSYVQKVSEPLL